ncbi:MAG: BRCT domain-containing protein [Anaerotignum sp.]
MRLYGDIHVAMHGELGVLREVAALIDQWMDEYPHFDEVGEMAEGIGEELQYYRKDTAEEMATVALEISTESSGAVLVFLNDMVETYPQMEMAVAAKIIYSVSDAIEYFAYYSPVGESTIFAAAEDPFCDENRVIAEEREWDDDNWTDEEEYEEDGFEEDEEYLSILDWGFPEEAEWIPFGKKIEPVAFEFYDVTEFSFDESVFVIAGIYDEEDEVELAETIAGMGGIVEDHVTEGTNYLIVDEACEKEPTDYRRALEWNKQGGRIKIVSYDRFMELCGQ